MFFLIWLAGVQEAPPLLEDVSFLSFLPSHLANLAVGPE